MTGFLRRTREIRSIILAKEKNVMFHFFIWYNPETYNLPENFDHGDTFGGRKVRLSTYHANFDRGTSRKGRGSQSSETLSENP